MGAKIAAAALALLVLAGALFSVRVVRPAYQTASLKDPSIAFDYPQGWETPEFLKDRDGIRSVGTKPAGVSPFDTAWDSRHANFMITEWAKEKAKDPKKVLEESIASAKAGYPDRKLAEPEAVTLGGAEGLAVTLPTMDESLDVGEPKRPGLFASLYKAVLGGEPSYRSIVVKAKDGKVYEIDFYLPGDKLARARYSRIYGKMLESLRFTS